MWRISGQKFDFEFEDIVADEKFILPTIKLIFHRSSKQDENQEGYNSIVVDMNCKLYVKLNDYEMKVIGQARSNKIQQTWKYNDCTNSEFELTLDHYTLNEIEKIRKNGDLNLLAVLSFQAYPVDQISKIRAYPLSTEFSVPKSTWVERVLPKLKYKNVALVEIPRIEYPKMNDAIDMLNAAWESYSGGDIDDVLTKCRKTLEELGNQVLAAKYVKKVTETDKAGKAYTKDAPDWNAFLGSESKGDIVNGIVKKMFDFVAPGAHAHVGGILEMNHAYFALLQTFSLTHLITSRFKMIDKQRKSQVKTRKKNTLVRKS